MLPTIAQVCSLNSPFERDIEGYAAGHCGAVEIWLGKLESYLDHHSIDDVRRLLADNEMAAPVASYQGGLLTSQGERRAANWAHFARRLELCEQLNIETIVVAIDIASPLTQQDLDRANASLVEAASAAARHSVRLALEFQASSAFGSNLHTAAAMVAEAGEPNLGICLDAFHYHCGPSKPEDLAFLTTDNLFHVQLCDLVGQARELAADGDRILPGDGDIAIEPIVEHCRRIGYAGAVSVELMNPQLWQVPPRQFGEIAVTALRKLLGLAQMDVSPGT